MKKAVIAIVASMVFLALTGGFAMCDNGCGAPPAPSCPPQPQYITKMVPCVKTEMVAEVVPSWRMVTVKKTAYKCQKVMLKGTPVGAPCGVDPCTQCCPQPFCQVVDQMVPYEYCEQQCVPSYNVVYRPSCKQVWLPQTYRVDAYPMGCCPP